MHLMIHLYGDHEDHKTSRFVSGQFYRTQSIYSLTRNPALVFTFISNIYIYLSLVHPVIVATIGPFTMGYFCKLCLPSGRHTHSTSQSNASIELSNLQIIVIAEQIETKRQTLYMCLDICVLGIIQQWVG